MAYEVTRVHLEMSVEDYDAFREWMKEKEDTGSITKDELISMRSMAADLASEVLLAFSERNEGTFKGYYLKSTDNLICAYKKAKEFITINKI